MRIAFLEIFECILKRHSSRKGERECCCLIKWSCRVNRRCCLTGEDRIFEYCFQHAGETQHKGEVGVLPHQVELPGEQEALPHR